MHTTNLHFCSLILCRNDYGVLFGVTALIKPGLLVTIEQPSSLSILC